MKLLKSTTGKILVALYYSVFFVLSLIFIMFIMIKASILLGLGIGLLLGIAGGIIGAELEYYEHRNMIYKRYFAKEKSDVEHRIIAFPKE